MPGSTTYSSSLANQFAWNANSSNVQTVITRASYSSSREVEIGGTALGDLNGDGYTDYLMTFEGHAEICYSNGTNGFDCRLMEDLTPSNWSQPPWVTPQGQKPHTN